MTTSKSDASRMNRIASKLSETPEGRHVLLQQVLTGEGLPALIALRRIERMLEAGASVDELRKAVAEAITVSVSPMPAATVRDWLDSMAPVTSRQPPAQR